MTFDAARAAGLLIAARRGFTRFAPPAAGGPKEVADAYRVQDLVLRALGPAGGWKVGAAKPGDVPTIAPIGAGGVRPSPAIWPARELGMIGVEAEIAFTVGRDLPAGAELDDRELHAAVTSVHAAIEVVDTRLLGWPEVDPLWKLADNQNNAGLAVQPGGVPWDRRPLGDAPVRLSVDGRVLHEKTGGNTAGEPVWLLEWAIRHLCRERGGVPAGTLITTGSTTGLDVVRPGTSVVAEFPGIGRAEVTFPA